MSEFDYKSNPQSINFHAPELREHSGIIFALSNSNLYKHFLERFLDGLGRFFRVPWWVIHITLYVAIWITFVLLIDVPKLYAGGGYFSFGGEQIGEFIFTTFMLFHIRKSRSIAILAAARITNLESRFFWLRRYLAPAYWGWVVRWNIHQGKRRPWILKTWVTTASLLTVYLGSQFIYYHCNSPWLPHSHNHWGLYYYPYPQLIYLYGTIAKVSMLIAAFAQFWWLFGIMAIVRGKYHSNLSLGQKRLLYFECCQAAIRLSMAVSAATAIWVLGHALAYGFTGWCYLYSIWLAFLFVVQAAIIKDAKVRFKFGKGTFHGFFRELIVPDFAVLREYTGLRRFATILAIWGLILCPGPLAQLAASASTP